MLGLREDPTELKLEADEHPPKQREHQSPHHSAQHLCMRLTELTEFKNKFLGRKIIQLSYSSLWKNNATTSKAVISGNEQPLAL